MTTEQYRRHVNEDRSESEISAAIRRELARRGWLSVRFNSGGRVNDRTGRYVPFYDIPGLGSSGLPDLLAMRGNRYMWLEVKTAAGRLRPSQAAFQRIAETMGIPVYVVRSLDELAAILDNRGTP